MAHSEEQVPTQEAGGQSVGFFDLTAPLLRMKSAPDAKSVGFFDLAAPLLRTRNAANAENPGFFDMAAPFLRTPRCRGSSDAGGSERRAGSQEPVNSDAASTGSRRCSTNSAVGEGVQGGDGNSENIEKSGFFDFVAPLLRTPCGRQVADASVAEYGWEQSASGPATSSTFGLGTSSTFEPGTSSTCSRRKSITSGRSEAPRSAGRDSEVPESAGFYGIAASLLRARYRSDESGDGSDIASSRSLGRSDVVASSRSLGCSDVPTASERSLRSTLTCTVSEQSAGGDPGRAEAQQLECSWPGHAFASPRARRSPPGGYQPNGGALPNSGHTSGPSPADGGQGWPSAGEDEMCSMPFGIARSPVAGVSPALPRRAPVPPLRGEDVQIAGLQNILSTPRSATPRGGEARLVTPRRMDTPRDLLHCDTALPLPPRDSQASGLSQLSPRHNVDVDISPMVYMPWQADTLSGGNRGDMSARGHQAVTEAPLSHRDGAENTQSSPWNNCGHPGVSASSRSTARSKSPLAPGNRGSHARDFLKSAMTEGKTLDAGEVLQPDHIQSSFESIVSKENDYLHRNVDHLRRLKHRLEGRVNGLEDQVSSLEEQLRAYRRLFDQMRAEQQARSQMSGEMEIHNLYQQLSAVQVLKDALNLENIDLNRRLRDQEAAQQNPIDNDCKASATCVICMDNLANTVCLPCKHLALCGECSCEEINACPICRASLTERMRIYMP